MQQLESAHTLATQRHYICYNKAGCVENQCPGWHTELLLLQTVVLTACMPISASSERNIACDVFCKYKAEFASTPDSATTCSKYSCDKCTPAATDDALQHAFTGLPLYAGLMCSSAVVDAARLSAWSYPGEHKGTIFSN